MDAHGLCCSLKSYWCLLVMLPLGATLMWMACLLPGAIVMPSLCYMACDAAYSHIWVCGPTKVWVYVEIRLLWSMLPPQAMQISFSMLWPEVMLLFVGQATARHHTYLNGLHLRPWRCPGPCCHQGPYLGPRSYCSLIFADIPGSCCHWKPSRCQWSMLHLEAVMMFMVPASESLVWVCGPVFSLCCIQKPQSILPWT